MSYSEMLVAHNESDSDSYSSEERQHDSSDDDRESDDNEYDQDMGLKLDKWLSAKEKREKKKDGDNKTADVDCIMELVEPLTRFCFETKKITRSKRMIATIRKNIKPF